MKLSWLHPEPWKYMRVATESNICQAGSLNLVLQLPCGVGLFFATGDSPVHWRVLPSMLCLYPLDARSIASLLHCDNQKWVQTSPSVLKGAESRWLGISAPSHSEHQAEITAGFRCTHICFQRKMRVRGSQTNVVVCFVSSVSKIV